MPEREDARKRAQATVDAGAGNDLIKEFNGTWGHTITTGDGSDRIELLAYRDVAVTLTDHSAGCSTTLSRPLLLSSAGSRSADCLIVPGQIKTEPM